MFSKIIRFAIFLPLISMVFAQNTQILTSKKIIEEIVKEISKKSGYSTEDLIVEFKTQLTDEFLPEGNLELLVNILKEIRYPGLVPTRVEILLDNKIYKILDVYLHVDFKTNVYIASDWIKRGEPLTDKVTLIQTRLSEVPIDAVTEEKELEGKVSKVAIPKGRIISHSLIDEPPVIKRNDIVSVVLERKNLKITTKGIALNDSRKDQIVKVRPINSKKEIYGRAKDNGIVLVEMD